MNRTISQAIAEQARMQNGVVTYQQLLASGVTRAAVRAMVGRGALIRIFQGIYAVADPTLLPLARQTGIVLSLGAGSVLSHRSAAALWGVAEGDQAVVDVTLTGKMKRARPGVRLHGAVRLHPPDIRTRSNIRLTSPARTLIDFAAQAPPPELESAFGEARAKRLITDPALSAALARAPRTHTGAAILRRLLRSDRGSTYTRSKAETRIRQLMRAAELAQPLVNIKLHGFTVDFLWPEQRLILEVDGYGTHGHRLAFEHDRRRDQVHVAAGYTVIRVTWDQLCHEPFAVAARIAQALARRAA